MQSGRSGISLVETLVAVVLLVVVLIPVITLMQNSTQQLVQSRNTLVAEQLAQALIETYPVAPERLERALSGGSPQTCEDLLTHAAERLALTAGSAEVEDTLRASRFTMRMEVERGVSGHAGLARVETRVDWDEGTRRVSRTFARLVCL